MNLTWMIRQAENRIMNVVTVYRFQDTFFGSAPGVVHRLDDGTGWGQVGRVEGYGYPEQPG